MTFFKKVLSGEEKSFVAKALRASAWVASKPYGGMVRLRNLAYDKGWLKSTKVDVPVISIGNLTVGGTGKTPAVSMICRYLREKGVRVAVISRGYGAVNGGMNDEAMELENQLPDVPHVQNADRIAAAQLAIEELETQLLVMDDGFQHRRLERDLDIVLIDASEPFGYGHLLPRGLLRESVRSLRRADLVIATRADQVDEQKLAEIRTLMQRFATNCGWVEAIHQPKQLRDIHGQTQSLETIRGRHCLLFCGIGNPIAFKKSVQQCGGIVDHFIEFPDHHAYDASDISGIAQEVARLKNSVPADELLVICTGKDIAKINLAQMEEIPVYAFEIGLQLRYGQETFFEKLDRVIQLVQP